MRSMGILTMGTAFPRVPPRNDRWLSAVWYFNQWWSSFLWNSCIRTVIMLSA